MTDVNQINAPVDALADEGEKPRVYLETSFMFYLTGRETSDPKIASDQAYTRRWWEEQGPRCELFCSQFVVDESLRRDMERVRMRQEMIAKAALLPFDAKVDFIAQKLLDGFAVPKTEMTDAQHIAISAFYGMDYLLSWNCHHLANPVTFPKTKRIIESFGLTCPAIITPRSYLEDFRYEGQ